MENKQTCIWGINKATVTKQHHEREKYNVCHRRAATDRTHQERGPLAAAAMLAFLSASSSETSWTISG